MSDQPPTHPPAPPVTKQDAQRMARRLKERLRLARCIVEREIGHSMTAIVPPTRSHSTPTSPRPQTLSTVRSLSATVFPPSRHMPTRNHSASTSNPLSIPSSPLLVLSSTPERDAEVAQTILMLATPPVLRTRPAVVEESPTLRRRLEFGGQRQHRRVVSAQRFDTPNLSQIAALPQRPVNAGIRKRRVARSSSSSSSSSSEPAS